MDSRTPVVSRNNREAYFWEVYQYRVRDDSLEALEFLLKERDKVSQTGWYVKHCRPATSQEKQMYSEAVKE